MSPLQEAVHGRPSSPGFPVFPGRPSGIRTGFAVNEPLMNKHGTPVSGRRVALECASAELSEAAALDACAAAALIVASVIVVSFVISNAPDVVTAPLSTV